MNERKDCKTCLFKEPCIICMYKNKWEHKKDQAYIPMTLMSKKARQKIFQRDKGRKAVRS